MAKTKFLYFYVHFEMRIQRRLFSFRLADPDKTCSVVVLYRPKTLVSLFYVGCTNVVNYNVQGRRLQAMLAGATPPCHADVRESVPRCAVQVGVGGVVLGEGSGGEDRRGVNLKI